MINEPTSLVSIIKRSNNPLTGEQNKQVLTYNSLTFGLSSNQALELRRGEYVICMNNNYNKNNPLKIGGFYKIKSIKTTIF